MLTLHYASFLGSFLLLANVVYPWFSGATFAAQLGGLVSTAHVPLAAALITSPYMFLIVAMGIVLGAAILRTRAQRHRCGLAFEGAANEFDNDCQ